MSNATRLICQFETGVSSVGIINGNNPTKFALPLFLLQISVASSFTLSFEYLLRPFGFSSFISQMLGAIAMGPSLLTSNKNIEEKLFYSKTLILIDTYESLALMLWLFLFCAKLDFGVIRKAEKLPIYVALFSFIVPFIFAAIAAHSLKERLHSLSFKNSIASVVCLESSTWFGVTFEALSHLKLVNSELGRVALQSSMINTLLTTIFVIIVRRLRALVTEGKVRATILTEVSQAMLILMCLYVFRPLVLWALRQTPEGKSLRESYLCLVALVVLWCGVLGEITSQTFVYGLLLLGLITPRVFLMGSGLFNKLGTFLFVVLMPCFLISLGLKVDLFHLGGEDAVVVGLITLATRVGKVIGTLVPALYFKMPFTHALSLSFLLSIQGHYDVQVFKTAVNYKVFPDEVLSIVVVLAMFHSMVFTFLVKRIYNPSRKYAAYNRRTIQHRRPDSELAIVACFHDQESVPSVVSILEASNSTRESPLAVYALNLEELEDQTMPLFIQHALERASECKDRRRKRVMNAFRQYSAQNQGQVRVQCFTALVPHVTMHDDICTLALEKSVSLVVLTQSPKHSVSVCSVNRNVLDNAPCSVAVLLDRGLPDFKYVLKKDLTVNICAIFLGGPDDREALAFATRMADHPSIMLQVLRLIDMKHFLEMRDLFEERLDVNAIKNFKARTATKSNVEIKELRLFAPFDLMEVIENMDDEFDLILVGIRHDENSSVLEGLSVWSEIKELGVIGDLLASPDFDVRASVLAVQQQALLVEQMQEASISSHVNNRAL